MVRCLECNLLLADEIYDNETIISLYKESNFDYSNEYKAIPALSSEFAHQAFCSS